MKTFTLFLLVALSSCGIYEKNEGGNEFEHITEQVIKSKSGVYFEVKPIPMDKK